MNISKLAIVWRWLTGGSTGVIDYVLDIANNAVNALPGATKEKIAEVLAAIKRIISTAKSVEWLVPAKWVAAYTVTLTALGDVANALEDLKLTPEELNSLVTAWQSAYSAWRAE